MTRSLIRAEFHCHTIYSHDSLVELGALLKACDERGIDKIAVTDHGSMKGAFKAHKMAPDRFILGEEIKTPEGEILGYFMNEEIPQGLPAVEVVYRLRGQGAFISLAHPFDPYRSGWTEETLDQILPYIDGLEVFNARSRREEYNQKAYEFAMEHGKALMAGSDAHALSELGKASMTMPWFEDADGLRAAAREATISGELSGLYVHMVSTFARVAKKFNF
ncbi:MAG TPA: PHP-associated domain-containing protein [Anaerolineaceae bacterium]|mgnify:CR=1 FL=1|jgi:predicted metal-dependent phosphoesterase TrpH|nr:PHP-associated domain-containing protein [Anaerolineaceae bacterium]